MLQNVSSAAWDDASLGERVSFRFHCIIFPFVQVFPNTDDRLSECFTNKQVLSHSPFPLSLSVRMNRERLCACACVSVCKKDV